MGRAGGCCRPSVKPTQNKARVVLVNGQKTIKQRTEAAGHMVTYDGRSLLNAVCDLCRLFKEVQGTINLAR